MNEQQFLKERFKMTAIASSPHRLRFEPILFEKNQVYLNLACSYEAEFSRITSVLPDASGFFEPQTTLFDLNGRPTESQGTLAYCNEIPVGFGVVGKHSGRNDVAEFYIIPSMRGQMHGYHLAAHLFDQERGWWQVRQIAGAADARAFWIRAISKYTEGRYTEDTFEDPDWGVVTRQVFSSMRENI